jgi:ChrR Cupin-like domain
MFASDFGNLEEYALGVPALVVALLVGVVGAVMRVQSVQVAAGVVYLLGMKTVYPIKEVYMNRLFLVLAAITLSMTSCATREGKPATTANEHRTPLMVSFTDLKWTELPERKGMQFAVLSGDPKTGAYTQIRKVPAGTDNPPHSHSSELKNVIISGVWYTGADAASAKDFGPGSVVIMPANWVFRAAVHRRACES